MTVNTLPPAGRVRGAHVEPGPSPRQTRICVQYSDLDGRWHELSMPFLDAMYLLNLLKAMQMDLGFEMPDDPRET